MAAGWDQSLTRERITLCRNGANTTMTAKEARQITESNIPLHAGQRLADYACRIIKKAAENGECKLSNPFQGLRDSHTKADEESAYAILEQDGYSVIKLGDCNVIVSW